MQQKSSISPVSTISTNPPSSPSSNTSREALFSVLAGLFPLIAAAGVPSLEKSNPGRPRLVQGATFPLGLVIVYVVGAELFTGYPMWLVMTALRRKGKMMQYVKGLLVSWVGNLLGVLISAFCFSCLTNSLHEEPYRSGLNGRVTSDVVEAAWHVIFLKAIGCGFLVTLAMFLGTQNQDGISKTLGLHLPFFISITARFPYRVEYMYLAFIGMMLFSPVTVFFSPGMSGTLSGRRSEATPQQYITLA